MSDTRFTSRFTSGPTRDRVEVKRVSGGRGRNTNPWLCIHSQITRNPAHRNAALCLAIGLLLVHCITHTRYRTWRPIH